MHGSVCVKNGVVYVGRHAKTASVRSYDLDGHPLETSFAFRDPEAGRSAASGLAVDDDHRIWVADHPARRLRGFTLFGQEVAAIGGTPDDAVDRTGSLGEPVGVVATGSDDALELVVASRGVRRHALQVLAPESGRTLSLRPLGMADSRFQDLAGVARDERFLYAVERGAARVQVFRDLDFHFAVPVLGRGGRSAPPLAAAALSGGRFVVGVGGEDSALLLFDRAGRVERVLAGSEPDPTDDSRPWVEEPCGVALAEGERDADTRVAVLDRQGDRLQVLTLEGRLYGAFPDLPRS